MYCESSITTHADEQEALHNAVENQMVQVDERPTREPGEVYPVQ